MHSALHLPKPHGDVKGRAESTVLTCPGSWFGRADVRRHVVEVAIKGSGLTILHELFISE